MMGPGGNLESAMTLLDIVNDPKKYKAKLKDLAQAVVDADKRITKAKEAEVESGKSLKKTESAIKKLRAKELKLEKELLVKETEINEKLELLNGEISSNLVRIDEATKENIQRLEEIDGKVKYIEKKSKELSTQSALLKNLEDRLIKENTEIERKKKIIADL